MSGEPEPMPDTEPDIFATCNAGYCNAPATTWLYDPDHGWLASCKPCARREARRS